MRLTRRDWTFIAICLAVAVASLLVITRWFGVAFPEASIDFEYDRAESRTAGAALLRELGLDTGGMKHAVTFESDDLARIYLERTLGLERANRVMADEALVWYWRHRWFRPLQEEVADYLDLLRRIVEQGQTAGVFRRTLHPQLVAKAVFGILDEMVTSWMLSEKDYPLEDQAEQIADLVLTGLL